MESVRDECSQDGPDRYMNDESPTDNPGRLFDRSSSRIAHNHVETAKLLIEAAADVNAQGNQLDSPLDEACA